MPNDHICGHAAIAVVHDQSVDVAEMAIDWVGAFLTLVDAIAILLDGVLTGWGDASLLHRILCTRFGIDHFVSFMRLSTVPSLAAELGTGETERISMRGALVR